EGYVATTVSGVSFLGLVTCSARSCFAGTDGATEGRRYSSADFRGDAVRQAARAAGGCGRKARGGVVLLPPDGRQGQQPMERSRREGLPCRRASLHADDDRGGSE